MLYTIKLLGIQIRRITNDQYQKTRRALHHLPEQIARVAPGPRGRFLLGSASDLQRKGLLQFYQDAWKEYGDLVRFQMGPMTMHSIVRPEHVQQVLVKNQPNYRKGVSHDKLRRALGQGLVTAEGPLWQRQRRLMSPTYTPKAVTRFAAIMTDATRQMLERWTDCARQRQPIAGQRRNDAPYHDGYLPIDVRHGYR